MGRAYGRHSLSACSTAEIGTISHSQLVAAPANEEDSRKAPDSLLMAAVSVPVSLQAQGPGAAMGHRIQTAPYVLRHDGLLRQVNQSAVCRRYRYTHSDSELADPSRPAALASHPQNCQGAE